MARDGDFVIKFDEPTTFAFHSIFLNYFVAHVLKRRDDAKSSQLYFRLFRTGLIGDILYKRANEHVPNKGHSAECELLAALFESYLFLARTVYDYLLHYLENERGVKDASFAKFLKKVRDGKYEKLGKKFRDHLQKQKIFDNLRALRDSVKQKTSHVVITVKNNAYHVEATMYDRDGKKTEIDESLHTQMFGYTVSLAMLMTYLSEELTGVSFKDQLIQMEMEDKERTVSSLRSESQNQGQAQ